MMTKQEYLSRASDDDEWAPGWLAIDEVFDALYPGVEPPHLATNLMSRAMVGGENYLDGVSFYPDARGWFHLVTYGMSELYADPESYGGDESGWGYEMTMKVCAPSPEACAWAADSLGNLARYTFTSGRPFAPYQLVNGRGNPLRVGSDTLLTSYIVIPDTQAVGVDTVHGRLDFLQLVGITQQEADWISHDPFTAIERIEELAHRMAVDNPLMVTDLDRTTSYGG